jgi:hypothetical protein
MAKRGKVVLGNPELQRLRRGESVVIRLKPGMDEIELKASILVQRNDKPQPPIGSVESILDHMKFER